MSPREPQKGFDSFLVRNKIGTSRSLRRLTPAERWCYVAGVLGIASDSPVRGALLITDGEPATVEDIADQAGVPRAVAQRTLNKLTTLNKIELDSEFNCYVIPNWNRHQPASKSSETREAWRERKRRSRSQKHLVEPNASGNVTRNVTNVTRDIAGHVTRDVTAMSRPQLEVEVKRPPLPPLRGDARFEEWLGDHETVTGHSPPKPGTKARASLAESFGARLAEGYSLDELKLATVGAHEDPHRRENGYDTADSVLRPTKVASLIAKGKLRSGSRARQQVTSRDLVAIFDRPAGGAA